MQCLLALALYLRPPLLLQHFEMQPVEQYTANYMCIGCTVLCAL